ncbi:hypothetical protein ACWC4J_37355 [Streptomyces sp. NPDC001356]
MLSTLKTYSSKNQKFSFTLTFKQGADSGSKATLSLFADEDTVVVDLEPEDLKALTSALGEAQYATVPLDF